MAQILPPAEYPKGPVDFAFVKDKNKRERALADYQNVRNVTADFVREVVMKALTGKARQAAARRLGFLTRLSTFAWAVNFFRGETPRDGAVCRESSRIAFRNAV